MYLRAIYLVSLILLLGTGLIFLTVSGLAQEYISVVILLEMLIALLSVLAIIGIRHNSGMGRFLVGSVSDETSRFGSIVNGQQELITCFTPGGEFLFANDAYCEFVGKSRSDIIGTSIFDDVPAAEADGVRQAIADKIRNRQSWYFANSLKNKDGEDRSFEWSNAAHFNENGEVVEIHSVGRDVTDRVIAQFDLDARETEFRQLTNLASDWTWKMDKDLKFSWFSPNISRFMGGEDANKFLGYSRRDMFENKNFISKEWQAHIEVLEAHEPFRNFVYAFDDLKGQSTWRSISGDPLFDEEGHFEGYHGVGRDITDRVLAEEQVRKQRDELQRLNGQKDKFFSIIAHDLKNPVNVILGYAQLFSSDGNKMSREEIIQKTGHISESAHQLHQLVDDLLAWGETQMDGVELHIQSVEINSVLEDALAPLRMTANDKGVSLKLDQSTLSLDTDPNLLATIVRNLVGNAIKFSDAGNEVSISARQIDGLISIDVSDHGIGMSRSMIEDLFKLDKMKSRPGTAKESGSGLGLFLCREFAERLDGEITVESQENEGSTFSVTLPLSGNTERAKE
jgi:PAS domain S-box-containing protein